MKKFFYKTPDGTIYESVMSGINVQTKELWVCLKDLKDCKRYFMPIIALHNQRLVDDELVPDYRPLSEEESIVLMEELRSKQQDVGNTQTTYRTEDKNDYKPYAERTTKGKCFY